MVHHRVEPFQLLREAPVKSAPHVLLVTQEIGDGHFSAERKIDAIEVARPESRQGQGRFAQRFTRHRSGVDACPADFKVVIHQRHGFTKPRGRYRCGDTGTWIVGVC